MYEEKRIISTPISNNRINFDERVNRTIVVPSLIEGTIDDVVIGEETAIEADIDGIIVAGKGLQHFVFLRNSRVPTWIMDNHNHAFAFWHEALAKGFIREGSLLVHIDQHTDLATPGNFPAWKHPEVSHEGIVEEYVNTDLTIADFIVPALATGLISEALMVTGEERNGVGIFNWERQSTGEMPAGMSSNKVQSDGILIKKSYAGPLPYDLFPSVIVDLDLDYFSQGFDELKCFETVRYWIEKADVITVATSPLFIDQEKALTVLKSLQSSLVAL